MDSSPVNDVIVGGLDSVMPLDKAQKSLIEKVDAIIQDSVEQGNPDIAGTALNYLMGMSRISGLSLAKMIYTFKFQWKNFNRRETFEEYLDDFSGVKKVTVKRYYKVWEMLVSGDIPKEYSEKLKLLPIRCLIPVANMWSQGWEIASNQWLRLSNAPDPSTVNKIIREIKGKKPKAGSLQLQLAEDGTIYAWQDDKRYFVGSLNIKDENVIIQKAISRIMGDGKILEK